MKLTYVKEGENLSCPYTNQVLVEHNEEGFTKSKHTVFIASDEEWIHINDKYSYLINNFKTQNEYDYIGDYLKSLKIKGEIIVHNDGGLNIYWGFVND